MLKPVIQCQIKPTWIAAVLFHLCCLGDDEADALLSILELTAPTSQTFEEVTGPTTVIPFETMASVVHEVRS